MDCVYFFFFFFSYSILCKSEEARRGVEKIKKTRRESVLVDEMSRYNIFHMIDCFKQTRHIKPRFFFVYSLDIFVLSVDTLWFLFFFIGVTSVSDSKSANSAVVRTAASSARDLKQKSHLPDYLSRSSGYSV